MDAYTEMIQDWASKYNMSAELAEMAHDAFCGCHETLSEYIWERCDGSLKDYLVYVASADEVEIAKMETFASPLFS